MANRKPTTKSALSNVRIPPQNLEAEQSVLGSIMLSKNAIIKIADKINSEDFYETQNKEIYQAMLELFEKRRPIDVVTLTDHLESKKKLKEVGGASYLTNLVNSVPSAAHVVHYAEIVHNKGVLRRLTEAAEVITDLSYRESDEVNSLLDKAEQALFSVSQKYTNQAFVALKDILAETFERIDELHKGKGKIRGVSTGFRDLDNLLAGFQESDLIVLAARPSMGKTALALNIAQNVAVKGKIPVAIFSLEQSKEQIVDRLLCGEACVDAWKMRTGNLRDDDFPKIGHAMGVLSEAPIYIDDMAFCNVMEIRAKARRLQMEKGIGLIVVDYLQLMQGTSSSRDPNRVQEISEISRGLKALARELSVPVLALSQLSRAVEQRPKHIPQLSDLRESGCLAGDTLIFTASGELKTIKELVGGKKLEIVGVNENKKNTKFAASKIFSTGIKQLFEIKLTSGKEIRATANHKFLTINGWKRLDELKENDFIAAPRIIANIQTNNSTFSDNKIILLAHLIGDGCYLARQPLHYTNSDQLCLEIVDKASRDEFKTKNRFIKQKNWYHLYLSAPHHLTHNKRNPIVKWLDEELEIFNQRSGDKIIPKALFTASNKQIALFIKHLFATDGSLTKSSGQWRLYYASKSKKLILGLCHLLLHFGIHGIIKSQKKKNYDLVYNLIISGAQNQLLFLEKIGIFGKKNENVQKAIKELKQIETNTNIDIIPKEIWKKIDKKFHALNITTREFHAKMGWAYSGAQRYQNGISRVRLQKIARVLDDQELKDLASSDIFWEKIKSITSDKKEEVFDITVPKIHNFIANDIFVHNSIEQDADVVMFLFREDYYDKDTERKNIADLFIKKHRNGPIGDIELYFVPEQTKFQTIERRREGE